MFNRGLPLLKNAAPELNLGVNTNWVLTRNHGLGRMSKEKNFKNLDNWQIRRGEGKLNPNFLVKNKLDILMKGR